MLIDGFHGGQWLPPVPSSVSDHDKAALRKSLTEIEKRLTPASPRQILSQLVALAEYYGLKQDEDGLKSRLSMIVEDLTGFSVEHIAEAIKEHRRDETGDGKFFPKGQLRLYCVRRQAVANVMHRRALIALGLKEPTPWELDLLRRHADQQERRERFAKGPSVNLTEKIAALPPELAGPISKMVAAPHEEAARQLEAEREGTPA